MSRRVTTHEGRRGGLFNPRGQAQDPGVTISCLEIVFRVIQEVWRRTSARGQEGWREKEVEEK